MGLDGADDPGDGVGGAVAEGDCAGPGGAVAGDAAVVVAALRTGETVTTGACVAGARDPDGSCCSGAEVAGLLVIAGATVTGTCDVFAGDGLAFGGASAGPVGAVRASLGAKSARPPTIAPIAAPTITRRSCRRALIAGSNDGPSHSRPNPLRPFSRESSYVRPGRQSPDVRAPVDWGRAGLTHLTRTPFPVMLSTRNEDFQ